VESISSEDEKDKKRKKRSSQEVSDSAKADDSANASEADSRRKTKWSAQVAEGSSQSNFSDSANVSAAPAQAAVPEAARLQAQLQAAREKALAAASRVAESSGQDSPNVLVKRKEEFSKAKKVAPPPPWMAAKAVFKKEGEEPAASSASTTAEGSKKPKIDLGNLEDLQRTLSAERNKLRLFIIKAKQEAEERKERVKNGGAPDPAGETDKDEYYRASQGEEFGPAPEQNRFKVDGPIGNGVFSSVFRCKDTKEKKDCAVKFIRSHAMMRKAAEKEVEMYRRLEKLGPKEDAEGSQYLVNLWGVGTFEHQGHLCFVFELLMCDMRFALQKYGQGAGLPLASVKMYLRQLFQGLRALRRLKVIHGDLKPDNILMTMDKAKIKICDFGSAVDVTETVKTPYLQPRYYRAPEIILGVHYDTQIDMWSAGTTAFELATGRILFTGKTNNQMMKQMIDVCGRVDRSMLADGEYSRKHFSQAGEFLNQEPDSITGEPTPVSMPQKPKKPVQEVLEVALKKPPSGVDPAVHAKSVQQLGELVAGCLRFNPADRMAPESALALSFFPERQATQAAVQQKS